MNQTSDLKKVFQSQKFTPRSGIAQMTALVHDTTQSGQQITPSDRNDVFLSILRAFSRDDAYLKQVVYAVLHMFRGSSSFMGVSVLLREIERNDDPAVLRTLFRIVPAEMVSDLEKVLVNSSNRFINRAKNDKNMGKQNHDLNESQFNNEIKINSVVVILQALFNDSKNHALIQKCGREIELPFSTEFQTFMSCRFYADLHKNDIRFLKRTVDKCSSAASNGIAVRGLLCILSRIYTKEKVYCINQIKGMFRTTNDVVGLLELIKFVAGLGSNDLLIFVDDFVGATRVLLRNKNDVVRLAVLNVLSRVIKSDDEFWSQYNFEDNHCYFKGKGDYFRENDDYFKGNDDYFKENDDYFKGNDDYFKENSDIGNSYDNELTLKLSKINPELENLTNINQSSLKTVSLKAIEILLKTGTKRTVEKLVDLIPAQIRSYSESETFRVAFIDALERLSSNYNSRQFEFSELLRNSLDEQRSLMFKAQVVRICDRALKGKSNGDTDDNSNFNPDDNSNLNINNNFDVKQKILMNLCDYIEDSQYPELTMLILKVIGNNISCARNPQKYLIFIFNRLILENYKVQSAALLSLQSAASHNILRETVVKIIHQFVYSGDVSLRNLSLFLLERIDCRVDHSIKKKGNNEKKIALTEDKIVNLNLHDGDLIINVKKIIKIRNNSKDDVNDKKGNKDYKDDNDDYKEDKDDYKRNKDDNDYKRNKDDNNDKGNKDDNNDKCDYKYADYNEYKGDYKCKNDCNDYKDSNSININSSISFEFTLENTISLALQNIEIILSCEDFDNEFILKIDRIEPGEIKTGILEVFKNNDYLIKNIISKKDNESAMTNLFKANSIMPADLLFLPLLKYEIIEDNEIETERYDLAPVAVTIFDFIFPAGVRHELKFKQTINFKTSFEMGVFREKILKHLNLRVLRDTGNDKAGDLLLVGSNRLFSISISVVMQKKKNLHVCVAVEGSDEHVVERVVTSIVE
ncbi:Coatomer subunit gamma [Dictyocoela roeselum]|nr:Coatomer subunit gamma [Dictyocoela roeselum]